MKKIASIILAVIIAITLVSCGGRGGNTANDSGNITDASTDTSHTDSSGETDKARNMIDDMKDMMGSAIG